MGVVYRARDPRLDRQVAIKILPPATAVDEAARERLRREAMAIAALDHPFICKLFEIGEDGDTLFLVMEYVAGQTLHHQMREGPLPLPEALRLAGEIAEALQEAHARGFLHRDLKPANIMVTGQGHVKVMDFGLAKRVAEPASPADATREPRDAPLTVQGAIVGTPDYMSPEQLRGDPLGTPPGVSALLRRLLAKDVRDRSATFADVRAELAGLTHAPAPTVVRSIPTWGWVATGALAVSGLAVFVVAQSGVWRQAPRAGETAAAPAVIRLIAVLPLDNYSGDPGQDYFAEGMTDELTTDLATISQLRVISRGSVMQFKGEHRPPTPEIAKALNVDAVVEGSVVRVGDRVRITAQLIDARADKHLWARSFERDSRDVLPLQHELAAAIAAEIHVQLTPTERSRLTTAQTVDPKAHDAYLKGRYFFSRPSDENLKKAIAQFEEAVALSPDFAPAFSGLSDAYLWAGYNEGVLTASEARPKAKATAEKAIQLDDNSAEAHASLATFKLFYEYRLGRLRG